MTHHPTKFSAKQFIRFWIILLTDRLKHNLHGRGNNSLVFLCPFIGYLFIAAQIAQVAQPIWISLAIQE